MAKQSKRLKDFSVKHRYWADQTLKQLSFSINLFTTLGIGLLTFQISQAEISLLRNLDFSFLIDWRTILIISAISLSFLTVILGLTAVTAHLYELRITRHLSYIGKIYKIEFKDKYIDLSNYCQCANFFRTLFKRIQWINFELTKNEQLVKEYYKLNLQSRLLGDYTWKTHKRQLLTLLLSLIFYLAYHII